MTSPPLAAALGGGVIIPKGKLDAGGTFISSSGTAHFEETVFRSTSLDLGTIKPLNSGACGFTGSFTFHGVASGP